MINQAWGQFSRGNIPKAKQLVDDYINEQATTDYNALNLLGYIYLEDGKIDKAESTYQQWLQLSRKNHDIEQEHIALHQLAMVYRMREDYGQALELIQQEARIIEQHFPNNLLKQSVNNYEQGYLRMKLQQLNEAVSFMAQSLTQAEQTDDLIAQACAQRGMGEICVAQHKPSLARKYFKRAIQLFEQDGDTIGAQEVQLLMSQLLTDKT